MLNRVANETTIHGVKDAWRAKGLGRAFFLTVFVCFFIVMILQVKGLFQDYISEAVGTRVTSTLKSDTIELPSFYYCHKNWLPKIEALWQYTPLLNSSDSSITKTYDELYQECIHMAKYNITYSYPFDLPLPAENSWMRFRGLTEPKPYCNSFLDYWKSMLKQELVNAIVRPLEDRSFDYRKQLYDHRRKRPELSLLTTTFAADVLADPIQSLLNSEFSQSAQAFVENLVLNVTLDDEKDYKACTTCSVRHKFSSSIMSHPPYRGAMDGRTDGNLFFYLWVFGAKHQSDIFDRYSDPVHYYDALSSNILHPSAVSTSLDGVCWEYAAGPQYVKTKEAVGQKDKHVVIHMGGLIHQLRTLNARLRTFDSPMTPMMSDYYDVSQYAEHLLNTVMKYANAVDNEYYTDVAISKQKGPGLYFNQKIRVDSSNPLVYIKYWTKSNSHLNRKTWPCRHAPWSELDQAHCNQDLHRSVQDEFICQTYLPASTKYPETPVTNNTCIYDHTGLFSDVFLAMSDLTFNGTGFRQPSNISQQLSSFGPSRVRHDHRRDVISRLTKASTECPRPCIQKIFNHQTSYPSRYIDKTLTPLECLTAMAYWLTPMTFPSFYYQGLPPRKSSPKEWFWTQLAMIQAVYSNTSPFCSVIEFEQTETQGEISEEYLLYGLGDLVASLGGTIGLWIGASVISVVQLIYICCLEQVFEKTQRKVATWHANHFYSSSDSSSLAHA